MRCASWRSPPPRGPPDADLTGSLSEVALPLGEAFQLRDDVLGVFGNSEATGKPVGDDLREGKPTPLLALATERATPEQAALLEDVGDPDLDDEEVLVIQTVLVDTGALDEVERRIAALADEALAAIEAAPIADEARTALAELASYVAWRDR